MNRKTMIQSVLSTAVLAMVVNGTPARASQQSDDNIKSSLEKTYVYKTYLKDDAIKIDAEKGIITLTGTVSGAIRGQT